MSRPRWGRALVVLLIGVGVGAAVSLFLVNRELETGAGARPLPRRRSFLRALVRARGRAEGRRVLSAAQVHFGRLWAQRTPHQDRALRFHLERSILPGLALYRALLDEHDGDREAALAEVERVEVDSHAPARFVLSLLALAPDPFAMLRRMMRPVLAHGFPTLGWTTEWVEDGDRLVAFDATRCFYLDTLRDLEAPELCGVYCDLDDRLFAALPPTVSWERTGTLAKGKDRCDFRFRRTD